MGLYEIFRNGGFPMWFIVAFGFIALGAAARYAWLPGVGSGGDRLAFIRAMSAATLFATLSGLSADFAAVCIHVSGNPRFTDDPKWYFIVMRGLGEAACPGIIGFPFLALVALLVAVGRTREAPAA